MLTLRLLQPRCSEEEPGDNYCYTVWPPKQYPEHNRPRSDPYSGPWGRTMRGVTYIMGLDLS